MSYTDLDITEKMEGYLKRISELEAEKVYYQKLALSRLEKLENIPSAIKEYGYIDIVYFEGRIRLVEGKR